MVKGRMRAPTRVVCATGPESSGKTALCARLAERFNVPWLPEYAREYLDGRAGYDADDVAAIAKEQLRRERELVAKTAGGVVLDTDLSVIFLWWREKFGTPPDWLRNAFAAQTPRLYLLCRPDLPWQPDPLRESPGDRDRLFGLYRRLLLDRDLPCVEVRGVGAARVVGAARAVAPILRSAL